MRTRYFTLGTLVTALALFTWQALSNTALPWHTATMRAFADNAGALQALRSVAPANGVYFAPQGVLAAISLTPDLTPKVMGPMLERQAVIDIVAVLLVSWTLLRLPRVRPLRTASTLGTLGVAAGVIAFGSESNWYGFGAGYFVVNVIDLGIQLFLVGLLLETFRGRWVVTQQPSAAADTSGLRVAGGLPSLRSGATTRT